MPALSAMGVRPDRCRRRCVLRADGRAFGRADAVCRRHRQISPTLGVPAYIIYVAPIVGFASLGVRLPAAAVRDARRADQDARPANGSAGSSNCDLADPRSSPTAMMFLGFEMFLVLGVPSWLIQQAYLRQHAGGGAGPEDDRRHRQQRAAGDPVLHLRRRDDVGRPYRRLLEPDRPMPRFAALRGGPAYGAIGSCMAFGSVCGSAPATVAALGRLMYPSLRAAGFSDAFSLGLIVSAAETALLIPPSITLIIYGWITETSISRLFAGGLIVGVVLGLGVRRPRDDRGLAARYRPVPGKGRRQRPGAVGHGLGAGHAGHHPRRHLSRDRHRHRGGGGQRHLRGIRRGRRVPRADASPSSC